MAAQALTKLPETYNPQVGRRYTILGQRVICKVQTHSKPCVGCAFSGGCHYYGKCSKLSRDDRQNVYFEPVSGSIVELAKCQYCGTTFEKATTGQRYCSNECSAAATNRKGGSYNRTSSHAVVCKVCGTVFKAVGRRTYCSEGCSATAKRQRLKAYMKTYMKNKRKNPRPKHGPVTVVRKVCERCGKEYSAGSYTQKYCHDCQIERINSTIRLPMVKCEVCGKEFQPHRKTQTTCGNLCWQRMDYRRRHPKVDKPITASKRVRYKPNGKCRVCGSPVEGNKTVCSGACRGMLSLAGRIKSGSLGSDGRHKSELTCTVCGAKYQGYAGSKYCDGCRGSVRYKLAPKARTAKECLRCGKEFMGTAVQKYCCHECERLEAKKRYNKNRREGNTQQLGQKKKCVVCDKEFTAKMVRQICCSPECGKANNNAKTKAANAGRKLQVYLVNSSDSENLTQKPVIITE